MTETIIETIRYQCEDGSYINVASKIIDILGIERIIVHQRWVDGNHNRVYLKIDPETSDILLGHVNLIELEKSTCNSAYISPAQ